VGKAPIRPKSLVAAEVAAQEERPITTAAVLELRQLVSRAGRQDFLDRNGAYTGGAAHYVRVRVRIDDHVTGVKVHGGMAGGIHPTLAVHKDVKQRQAFGIRQDSGQQGCIRRFQSPGRGKLSREKQCAGKSHDA
jgi:hypothetical protein